MAKRGDEQAKGTRAELLALLRRSERSIPDLAAELGISGNAVRVHVAALERDGLVEPAGVNRETGGKPARLFRVTARAEERQPKGYALVLGELLDTLEEQMGRDEVVRLLRDVGARAAPERGDARAPLEARVESAADVLRGLGGDVEVERSGHDWVIRGFSCPLSAVARDHGGVCCLAESLVERIAGAPTAEICTRGERPRCAFRILGEPAGE